MLGSWSLSCSNVIATVNTMILSNNCLGGNLESPDEYLHNFFSEFPLLPIWSKLDFQYCFISQDVQYNYEIIFHTIKHNCKVSNPFPWQHLTTFVVCFRTCLRKHLPRRLQLQGVKMSLTFWEILKVPRPQHNQLQIKHCLGIHKIPKNLTLIPLLDLENHLFHQSCLLRQMICHL